MLACQLKSVAGTIARGISASAPAFYAIYSARYVYRFVFASPSFVNVISLDAV